MRNPFEYLDHKEKTRRSNDISHLSEYEKITNKRIRNLMIIIVVLFAVLILQLFNIQILQNEKYLGILAMEQKVSMYEGTSRGEIFDRNGKEVASTKTVHSITYFPKNKMKEEELNELALRFAKQFKMTSEDLNEDDLKVLYMQSKDDGGASLLNAEEIEKISGITDSKEKVKVKDDLIKSHIDEEMLSEISEDDRLTFLVKTRMDHLGNSNNKRTIVQGVHSDDLAYLVEHAKDFPGFEPNYTSWEREYAYKEDRTFQSVLGKVTSSTQGLPLDLSDKYLAQGYAITDRVGASGLEQQYEDLLFGTKTQRTLSRNANGELISTVAQEGKKGYDLHLSVDMELQKATDDILKRYLTDAQSNPGRSYFKQAYVTLLNPVTGDVYAMSGIGTAEDNSLYEFAAGNYMSSFLPGSSIKGATVYMGLNEGVVSPEEIINDAPLDIPGTPTKGSYQNHGNVNAISALERSSNVYMYQIAIRLGGGNYIPKQPLNISDANGKAAFQKMRNYYSSFGLGVASGIDVPNENVNTGFVGSDTNNGHLLDFAIGQYDTYTTLQLSVYAATIANGGYNVTPRLVSYASDINDAGRVVYENPITMNNHLIGNTEYLDQIEQGFRNCVIGTTGYSFCGGGLNTLPFPVYAKTGTAEERNGETNNSIMIGYVKTESPQLAFACMTPESVNTTAITSNPNVCSNIVYDLLVEANNRGYISPN